MSAAFMLIELIFFFQWFLMVIQMQSRVIREFVPQVQEEVIVQNVIPNAVQITIKYRSVKVRIVTSK